MPDVCRCGGENGPRKVAFDAGLYLRPMAAAVKEFVKGSIFLVEHKYFDLM